MRIVDGKGAIVSTIAGKGTRVLASL